MQASIVTQTQEERLPVAAANAALSESNWKEAVRVPSMLGLDPRAADLLSSVANQSECLGSLLWLQMQQSAKHSTCHEFTATGH